ncbi:MULTISPECIES: hypothetical protein [unclassified Nocardiopsis]|uniref:hypothetical protein n=1 Tax=unclassified Nocardiopsis TaxID=2649073 RepID=UPI00066B9135|nr:MULTISPECIES: hypothetical protein [unclassified Nocardiopsis]MBQ1080961.1 hypothetical protein [Nocardiopsis sp. B62]
MRRCDFCELPLDGGCACALRTDRRRGEATTVSEIHIHSSGKAHLPGCQHQYPSGVSAPKWGWVLDADPSVWRRISEGSPLRATHGNTDRVATSRCKDCDV